MSDPAAARLIKDMDPHRRPGQGEEMLILIMGTFDPPTNAHIAMGTTLAGRFPDADILYVLSGDTYLKTWKGYSDGEVPDIHERAVLLEGALLKTFAADEAGMVSDEEAEGYEGNAVPDRTSGQLSESDKNAVISVGERYIGVSEVEADPALTDGKTYNTAAYFKRTTGKEIYIAIGSDQLEKFIMWYKVKELVDEFHFIVFCRGMSEADCTKILEQRFENVADRFTFVQFPYRDVSSTRVREACARGELESIRDLIPESVYRHLQKKNGYHS